MDQKKKKKTINASNCSGHVFINSMSLSKLKSANYAISRDKWEQNLISSNRKYPSDDSRAGSTSLSTSVLSILIKGSCQETRYLKWCNVLGWLGALGRD